MKKKIASGEIRIDESGMAFLSITIADELSADFVMKIMDHMRRGSMILTMEDRRAGHCYATQLPKWAMENV